MDEESVSTLVRDVLANYHYEPPPPGSTIGVRWSAEKVSAYVEKLKKALVKPYLRCFELRETHEQIRQSEPSYAEFWVVAESVGYLEWFDPVTGDFGLGHFVQGTTDPVSIGVRGDLVGVFCAR